MGADDRAFDVVVVGAGAAGVGVGVALRHAGIEDFVVIDRHHVGASFDAWPAETRFITPSFPSNSVGMLDLNAVAVGTSPAFSMGVEHPSGPEFAEHLRGVADFFELPIRTGIEVTGVADDGAGFIVETASGPLRTRFVIWAAGEFQYPRLGGFPGAEHCLHTANIRRYEDLVGDDWVVIGGYESGVDAAYHLARRGRRVRLFDGGCPWGESTSDPSVSLSTYSQERMSEEAFVDRVELHPQSPVAEVTRVDLDDSGGAEYETRLVDGRGFRGRQPPLLATGFAGSWSLVGEHFWRREDGYPELSEEDESTVVPGLFLVGPAVRHDSHVFCFIFKFRQRFAVVAKAIATRLGLPAEELEAYRRWGMYLDDLSCCGEECAC